MKKPEEITKGLEQCYKYKACGEECPYYTPGDMDCVDRMLADALALIRQLSAGKASMEELHGIAAAERDIRSKLAIEQSTRIAELEKELEAVKRERDAAMRDCGEFPCNTCDDRENRDLCCNCIKTGSTRRTNHVWRGVCPENTEVQG